MHNIIVAVEQTIPDLQKKWTRFGDNRPVYSKSRSIRFSILGENLYEEVDDYDKFYYYE